MEFDEILWVDEKNDGMMDGGNRGAGFRCLTGSFLHCDIQVSKHLFVRRMHQSDKRGKQGPHDRIFSA